MSQPPIAEKPRAIWRAGTLTYTTGGLVLLFAWLLWGDFAWNMKDRAVTPVAQLMLRQFHASDFLVGLLVGSLPCAIGFILGPIISVKSDNHRGRWGRRIPFLLIPTPFIALAMVGLAFTVPVSEWLHAILGPSSPGQVACQLVTFGFFWTTFEIFQTIAQAVFGGLINDVVPQEIIGRFFGFFRAISLVAAMVFNFWIIGHAEEYFGKIFIGLGLLYGIGFSLMCFMVREGDYPPPAPRAQAGRLAFLAPVKAYMRECFANPYYLWIFLAMTLGILAGGPINTYSIFYAKSLGMSVDAYGKLLVITYAISFTLSFILGWLADKFHPLRVGFAAILIYAAVMIWGGFVADSIPTFSFVFIAHGVLMGCFITGTASLGQRLFPQAKFAQFASAAGIASALGYMILPPAVGYWLDATGHVYRYTFLASGAIGMLSFIALMVTYGKFLKLGGDKNYSPPL
ncbi:MAG: MFS transporter [Verrucomicrobiota bacterium]